MTANTGKWTIATLSKLKAKKDKIAALTAYDALFAHLAEEAGVEVLLVGDSLGMVVQGHATTVPVTMDQMVYHTEMVHRGRKSAFLLADLPFLAARDIHTALYNAGRLMQEGGADMVKLEVGSAQIPIIANLVEQGIPVCAHLGLLPQQVHRLGGYRVLGRESEEASMLMRDARLAEEAGAQILLLESVPAPLAAEITRQAEVPVIGIGAGVDSDGQILVMADVLGLTPRAPRFARNFMTSAGTVQDAFRAYVDAVKSCAFPSVKESFGA